MSALTSPDPSMFKTSRPMPSGSCRRSLRDAAISAVVLLFATSLSGSAQAHALHAAVHAAVHADAQNAASSDVSTLHSTEGRAPWAAEEDWIVDALTHGNVVQLHHIGHGITNPFRAEIHHEGRRLHAVWKPIVNSDYVEHETYHAEIAAYRLSRALGLDMVPPTVERKVGRRWGSLQFWVDDYELFAEAGGRRPLDGSIIPRLEAMRFFDALIDNPDRHAGNYMVNDQWHVVLIDHSRAFDGSSRATKRVGPTPNVFPALALERLHGFDAEFLEELLGDVTDRSTRRRVLRSAQRLIEIANRVVTMDGSTALFAHDLLFAAPQDPENTLIAQQR